MKDIKEFINESLISEKLNYASPITKKICKTFGFDEQDEYSDGVDKWVTDNNVKKVEFYSTISKDELLDMGVPKSIVNTISDDNQIISKIDKSIENSSDIFCDEDEFFTLLGNSEVLAFIADSGDNMYAYNVK